MNLDSFFSQLFAGSNFRCQVQFESGNQEEAYHRGQCLAALPLTARAQQRKSPVIGFLSTGLGR